MRMKGGLIGRLVRDREWQRLADITYGRFGYEVSAKEMSKWLSQAASEYGKKGFWEQWSDCSWFCFIKNRLRHRMESGGIVHPEYHTATLHVWLLGCEETPEQLARLPEGLAMQIRAARSKISKTTLASIDPINQVAQKVLPESSR